MGCDGGSIPRRDEMVKLKKKAEKAERDVELMAKWRHCALSGEPLKQPVVGCFLGRMYNKESLILALLDKSNLPEVVSHIQSLKDTVQLKLTTNSSYQPSSKADSYNDVQAAEYVCPVSGLEMSGRYRFVFLACGCVVSEKALKEAPSPTCHKCGATFSLDEVVVIYGSEEDVRKQRERVEKRRSEAKLARQKRKAGTKRSQPESSSVATSKQLTDATTAPTTVKPTGNGTSSSALLDDSSVRTGEGEKEEAEREGEGEGEGNCPPAPKRSKPNPPPPNNGSASTNGAAKASSGSGVGGGGSKLVGRHSKGGGVATNSRAAATKGGSSTLNNSTAISMVAKRTAKAITSSYRTVADDPNARDAYKALFNSGSKERPKEQSAHWVTFFPYH